MIQLPKWDVPDGLPELPWNIIEGVDQIEIVADDADVAIRWLVARNVPLRHMTLRARSLEDLFLELTGRELRA